MTNLATIVVLFLLSIPTYASDNSIVGTWKIESFVREVVATGERQNEFGEKPDGYISYQPDGRMFAVLVGDNRTKPAGAAPTDEEKAKLFGTLIAYSGHLCAGRRQGHAQDRCVMESDLD